MGFTKYKSSLDFGTSVITPLLLLLAIGPRCSQSTCQNFQTLISCRFTAPNLETLRNAGMLSNLILSDYQGELITSTPEDNKDYSVMSIQIQKSVITNVQPRYFARFSNQALVHLTITTVNGTFQLDEQTLGGLESTLQTLRVNDHQLNDVSHLAKLQKLETLYLARTGLSHLPDNFASLMDHLIKLDVKSNQLTTMPWDAVAKRLEDVRFQNLGLGMNPWNCDCSLRPLIEASRETKNKVTGLVCSTPAALNTIPLLALKVEDVCSNEPILPETVVEPQQENKDKNKEDGGIGGATGVVKDDKPVPSDGTTNSDVNVARAGLSTEVIAVIAAVVVVVAIVLIAVIVFKVRSRSNKRSRQEAEKPSHKSTAYCQVIETSDVKSRPSGAASTGPNPSQRYRREMDEVERQPLAPPYRAPQDNRF